MMEACESLADVGGKAGRGSNDDGLLLRRLEPVGDEAVVVEREGGVGEWWRGGEDL